MLESKYERQFSRLRQASTSLHKLRGASLLVEILPKQELKTKSGLYLAQTDSHKAQADDYRRDLGLVLLQGEGYADGTPMDIKPGMVVLMPFNPLVLSEFPGLIDYTKNTLAIVNEGDILLTFDSLKAFQEMSDVLNAE